MKKNTLKKITLILSILLILAMSTVVSINCYVKNSSAKNIVSTQEFDNLNNYDCIVVLGCGVQANGKPSAMLSDRLKRATELYKLGVAPKILMSGDHGREGYDEVNTMKDYALSHGVSEEDIFLDHAGFSTYETMYRAKEIFGAEKIIVITQQYHLYRALYIADKLGLEAIGVNSDYRIYAGQKYRDAREIAARCKDFVTCIIKPEPTFLGETIPVSGDGRKSWD